MSNLNSKVVRRLLKSGDLRRLFVEELGWDRHQGEHQIERDGVRYTFAALAEKRGVVAFGCVSDTGQMPAYKVRVALEGDLRKLVHEHVIVFETADHSFQVWQWVRREAGKSAATREHHFHVSQPGDSLIAKLDQLLFTLDEESDVTISLVNQRARAAFDVETVTRKFYDRFQEEHQAFVAFIRGFADSTDAEWYASLMLNRLMFVYFMQKRGFIDDDRNYLQHRLSLVQESKGKGKFHSFYRRFLVRLFHDGLSMPEQERDADLERLLGRVPYLNGGLFEQHRLEASSKLDVADEAFERLFAFFDSYAWHLDDRPLKSDNEINPDVLGYIFEKYINQKDMGAYYTKEDVTGYIASNAICVSLLHRLDTSPALDRARLLLRQSPERYLYSATLAEQLPGEGRDAATRRNALREEAIRALTDGVDWNLAVSLNVDLTVVLDDVVQESSPDELLELWRTINSFTVLDPTCGSGAFLFAGLRVLQPLFEGVIARMEALQGSGEADGAVAMEFASVLERQRSHPSPTYFTVKCILLNNLYGVDIMEEAVEICKLRLFLHAAAALESASDLEPLPDLDFNIKCGNTIVGFASQAEVEAGLAEVLDIDEDHVRVLQACDDLAAAHAEFRRSQENAETAYASSLGKQDLQEALDHVRQSLNDYLLRSVGGVTSKQRRAWLTANRPFHWFAEFHDIVSGRGFDVIIGNPPYSEVPKDLSRPYLLQTYATALSRWSRDEDLYTFVVERSLRLLAERGVFGMVLPLSVSFNTKRSYVALRERLAGANGNWWFSHYDRIPSALFGNDVRTRCTIALHARDSKPTGGANVVGVTPLLRWTHEQRDHLFETLNYCSIQRIPAVGIPKLGSQRQARAYEALTRSGIGLGVDLTDGVSYPSLVDTAPRFPDKSVFVGGTAYNWFPVWREIPPTTDKDGQPSLPARTACYRFRSNKEADAVFALLGSSLGYWWWAVASDGFNLKKWLLDRFPIAYAGLSPEARGDLAQAGADLRRELRKHYVYKDNKGRIGNWYMPACAEQIRAIDDVVARHIEHLDAEFFRDVRSFNTNFSTSSNSEGE